MTNTKKTGAAKATENVEAAVAAGKETVETVVKAGADAAAKGVEKAVAMSQENVAAAVKAGSEAFKSYEDAVSFGKDNLEAVMKANAIFVKGVQDINSVLFGIAQTSIETNAAASKKIFACKNVQDMVAVHNDLAADSYAKVVDNSRKISDLSVKVAEEVAEPITKRVNATVEQITKPLAA
jgi:phasin family protein